MLLTASAVMVVPGGTQATPGPDLGTADPFVILSTAGITNVPTSAITGEIGVSPATGASITGITCVPPEVTGTIYTVNAAGPVCRVVDPVLLGDAIVDLEAARGDAALRTSDATLAPGLGGTTVFPGVYDSSDTTFSIANGTTLTLDAQGDPDAVFIFQSPAVQDGALTVNSGAEVVLTGGAQACNVWWSTGGATLNDGAIFKGNILSASSVTVTAGADIEGRLMASQGNVTLDQDTVTRADCAVAPPPAPPAPPAPPVFTVPPNFTG